MLWYVSKLPTKKPQTKNCQQAQDIRELEGQSDFAPMVLPE